MESSFNKAVFGAFFFSCHAGCQEWEEKQQEREMPEIFHNKRTGGAVSAISR